MVKNNLLNILENQIETWQPPSIEDVHSIPKGDMPGDKIKINETHIVNTNNLFKPLLKLMKEILFVQDKIVISIHGGSGVGKSETGALIGYYLNQMKINTYILSGDNYPRRIPEYNDAERLNVFRTSGLKGLIKKNQYTSSIKDQLIQLWKDEKDADVALCQTYPWLSAYQSEGIKGLKSYLGTPHEIDFDQINEIIEKFKSNETLIALKRMGRTIDDLWYDHVSFGDIKVLIIEWTHGNNDYLNGVDIPILLNSTPEETLAHRASRNRDGKIDSAFTSMVLKLEQEKLLLQSKKAKLILTKSGELIDYKTLLKISKPRTVKMGPMFNAYPDSLGGKLSGSVDLLSCQEVSGAFESFYILPSLFNTDLDRGFSVIDYDLNETLVSYHDLENLKNEKINLKLDFILNHASVLSPQFQDLLKHGTDSKYKDFFINWNEFWAGCGKVEEGVLIPDESYTKDMFFRKPGLPILRVRMPNGAYIPYWNTFYQEIRYQKLDPQDIMALIPVQYGKAEVLAKAFNKQLDEHQCLDDLNVDISEPYKNKIIEYMESNKKYLGQMDLNIASPLVWAFYENTLDKIAGYGAEIVRLDAFAYAPKAPGKRNFLNDPETWEVLDQVNEMAQARGLSILPEIHSMYHEKIHSKIAEQGYMTYDFFLPGLIIDAFERSDASYLKRWITEILDENIKTVNMLGCHDGIPLLDLKGLLPDEQIENLIKVVVARGGHVKDLHGKKNLYYQVNATYFSAIGEDESKLILARALQMFMPGKPQVWYLDLFGGKNDYEAVKAAGSLAHKEINRTNFTMDEIYSKISEPVVTAQLDLLKLRNSHPAFTGDSRINLLPSEDHELKIEWHNDLASISIEIDFKTFKYKIHQ
ncbi:MAG: sucrose phosphorylase [Clostridia bacterium]|nr:sucrose phosphorylase [Clostridia bacterium]